MVHPAKFVPGSGVAPLCEDYDSPALLSMLSRRVCLFGFVIPDDFGNRKIASDLPSLLPRIYVVRVQRVFHKMHKST